MKLSQILRWVEVVLPLISTGIFTVIAKVFMQNHEIVNHIILALFLGGLVGVYVMYKIDRLDRIITKNTDKLTLGEVKSGINIELRLQAFFTDAKQVLNKVHELENTLAKVNDLTCKDLDQHNARLTEIYEALETLKNSVPTFNHSVFKSANITRNVKPFQDYDL